MKNEVYAWMRVKDMAKAHVYLKKQRQSAI
jgi:hypothetical protein